MSEVQMIAVQYPYSGSVGELAHDVAFASSFSALTLPVEKVSDWLSARFTKSVRRVREGSKFEKLSNLDDAMVVGSAIVFPPQKYDVMPKLLSKTQLFKEDLPLKDFISKNSVLNVFVNKELGMSSGKVAAQVSHAVLAWHLKHGEEKVVEFNVVFISEAEFIKKSLRKDKEAVLIVDAGLTEIPSETATVLAEVI